MQQRFFHLLRSFITLINLSELYYQGGIPYLNVALFYDSVM